MPDAAAVGARALSVVDAGLMAYERCLALQLDLHAQVASGAESGYLLVVEHPPVVTFGKHATQANLRLPVEQFAARGVALVRTDRGGDVTAHEPGQLVLYPLLRLGDFGVSPRGYVELLEAAVIRTLAGYGVVAATDPAAPGVWLGNVKICAIGIRIKQRATLHGLALNVSNSLELFDQIVPCGLVGRGVTSLSRQLGRDIKVRDVATRLVSEVLTGLGAKPGAAATRMAYSLQWEG